VASSEALSILHQVMHDASSGAAANFIKTDKNNHQNHVSDWDFLVQNGTLVGSPPPRAHLWLFWQKIKHQVLFSDETSHA
jgi:hypothetical protein